MVDIASPIKSGDVTTSYDLIFDHDQNLLLSNIKYDSKTTNHNYHINSAKHLVEGEPNVSYICSRYYRAPELIFGATDYTTMIDVWSAGCVLAELLLGQPIFPGDSGVDQLVEIIKVLGTPTRDQIREMNKNYTEFKFPQIKAHPWQKVFRTRVMPEAIDLVSKLLEYTPTARMTPLQACAHPFFDELREAGTRLPNNRELPPLFNFTEEGNNNRYRDAWLEEPWCCNQCEEKSWHRTVNLNDGSD